MTFVPLVLIMLIFYFLLILPAQRRQKKTTQMLQALKNGDKVVTNGGIYGTDGGPGRRSGPTAHRRSGEDQAVAQRHRRPATGNTKGELSSAHEFQSQVEIHFHRTRNSRLHLWAGRSAGFSNFAAAVKSNFADRIKLGLDLQGGSHLVLQVQIDEAIGFRCDQAVDQLLKQTAR